MRKKKICHVINSHSWVVSRERALAIAGKVEWARDRTKEIGIMEIHVKDPTRRSGTQ